MILEVDAAWRFIEGYKKLLFEIDGESGSRAKGGDVPRLAKARAKLVEQPTLLQEAQARLVARSDSMDPEVLQAVEGLEVRDWVYLKDTKVHSIFMDAETKRAFGVVGLTDRLRDIVGGSGVFLKAGLVRYRGRFVCDGIVIKTLWLGPSYKKSFNAAFSEIKAEGRFYVKCNANRVSRLCDGV
jgi:hypothetical protein